jgi:glyoxylase-like metal-dependent hydrolase (beta-lactamase superfamily II)
MKTREIAEGLYMITLPMPFRLRYVNVFAALDDEQGLTLIDTGPNLAGVFPALEAALAQIGWSVEACRRILITHYHADHCGLAGLIAGLSGAEIFLSEIESQTIRTFADEGWHFGRLRRFGLENGLDAGTLETVARAFLAFRTATSPFTATGALTDGQEMTAGGRSMRVVSTPGHSRGHVSLYLPEERLLIAGDHVLPHITPNLSPDLVEPGFRPLRSFLGALERVGSLPVAMVYPAHGEPFPDLGGRIAQMRDHHCERKGLALAALADGPRTAEGVSRSIFGADLPPFDRLLALNEAYVHLIELEAEAAIRREMRDGRCFFTKA